MPQEPKIGDVITEEARWAIISFTGNTEGKAIITDTGPTCEDAIKKIESRVGEKWSRIRKLGFRIALVECEYKIAAILVEK